MMGETSEGRHYRLSSGLEVNLLQVSHLQKAAVVWTFPAGSHQEPQDCPGLAHLIEHMVFSGGEKYSEQQRLMPWIQQRGGRVNATTQQNYTAYYFEVDPHDLSAGLCRLVDMLTSPRFNEEDIAREITVIDEEYQLYTHSASTLASAALQSRIEYPLEFSRFHIGNLASFGTDIASLRQQLQQFFAKHYALSEGQLWIASPLEYPLQYSAAANCLMMPEYRDTIDEQQLTSRVNESPRITWQNWQGDIQLSQPPGVGISVVLPTTELNCWPLMVELMTDMAPGSLTQVMSQKFGHPLSVRVERHYHDSQQLFFTLWLEGRSFSALEAKACLLVWRQWLIALTGLSFVQFKHYSHLARCRALRLPAMEYLREYALGFIASTPIDILSLQRALLSIDTYALLTSHQKLQSTEVECQGLSCRFSATRLLESYQSATTYDFIFYPQLQRISPLLRSGSPSSNTLPVFYRKQLTQHFSVLMRPAAGVALTDLQRDSLTRALLPVFSLVKHAGGEVMWQQVQGNELLYLSFKQFDDLKNCLAHLVDYWPESLPDNDIEHYSTLALRPLLENMPSLLATSADQWMVCYMAPTQQQLPLIQSILSQLPIRWLDFTPDRDMLTGTRKFNSGAGHATLLAFIPYPLTSAHSLHYYQQLAGYYEQQFYYQLREIEAIGYAVACRQRIFRDRWGMQIILQSSHLSAQQLAIRVETFFNRLRLPTSENLTLSSSGSEGSGDSGVDELLSLLVQPSMAGATWCDSQTDSLQQAHELLVKRITSKAGRWALFE